MRIRTTGTVMVEKTLESMWIEDQANSTTDNAANGNGELRQAARLCIDTLQFPGTRVDLNCWPIETGAIRRAGGRNLRRYPQDILAIAAACLIREIDRLNEIEQER